MTEFEKLNARFRYEDGQLYSRGIVRGQPFGKPVGSVGAKGYLQVKFNGRTYLVHIIIWILCKGCRPRSILDHKDRNKLNNVIENLREVTHRENALNSNRAKKGNLPDNISYSRSGLYRVRVRTGNNRIERTFVALENAIEFRDKLLETVN